MQAFLIYGANAYTGELIAREAVARGLRPILAGRNAGELAELAKQLDCEHRVFSLDDPEAIERSLRELPVVLNCAGPFVRTFEPLAHACLKTGTHYLDITGEVQVFESLMRQDGPARSAAVMLLPGMGFDVVPTDCLAARLKRRLPTANRLALGINALTRVSRGTATTIVENLHRGGVVRQDGALQPVPAAWKTRVIDFGAGPKTAMTIPWGDVSTAYHSTGIPNIEVYMAADWKMRGAARLSRYMRPLFRRRFVQDILKRKIRAGPRGPTASQRARGVSYVWGEAAEVAGQTVTSRLRGPDGYQLTVDAALAGVERVLSGQTSAGFQTPSTAFGPDFVLQIPGIIVADEPNHESNNESAKLPVVGGTGPFISGTE